MLKMGVVGFGYWGPNVARNFNSTDDAKVVSVCDKMPANLKRVGKVVPGALTTQDSSDILDSPDIDAVAVVTPVSMHFELARRALTNGKHVFVEKPFTATVAQARELIDLAEKKKLLIMVDHTFIFTGAVRKIKEVITEHELGEIYYYDSTRVNLGLFQHDVNVIWDLAPHDFSIMLHVLKDKPVAVAATGAKHVNDMVNVAYVTVFFEKATIAHFNVNWLSPVKIRNTLIGGSKRMLMWNDVLADDKIKIYDKGVDVRSTQSIVNLRINYRTGDMWAPRIDGKEALALECEHFVDCIKTGRKPVNDGHAGLGVVQLLEACDKSLEQDGKIVKL